MDENTPVGDLLRDDRTAPIVRSVMASFGSQMGENGGDAVSAEAGMQMMDGMPLRAMVAFGGAQAAAAMPGLLAALRGAVPPKTERT